MLSGDLCALSSHSLPVQRNLTAGLHPHLYVGTLSQLSPAAYQGFAGEHALPAACDRSTKSIFPWHRFLTD